MKDQTILQKLMTTKLMTEQTLRAVRERLKIILDNKEKQFKSWNEGNRFMLNLTRQHQIERRFNKEIQALKIVIYTLTPFFERNSEDVPSIIVKKEKK